MSKQKMIDEIILLCNANRDNIYCDSEQLINMIREVYLMRDVK